ncbi:MAG: hypothetical protein ACYDD1_02315 [Caulobacteraceae bacterium]
MSVTPPTEPVGPPIVVHAEPTAPQLEAAIRQILLALIPVCTAFGMTKTAGYLNMALGAAGFLATAGVAIYGQLVTRRDAKQKALMAKALPNSVAMTTDEVGKTAS